MKLTRHAQEERLERLAYIGATIGFGKPIKEDRYQSQCYQQLTDTGVILIKSEDRTKLITAYIATERKVKAMYHGRVPKAVMQVVIKNRLHSDLTSFFY